MTLVSKTDVARAHSITKQRIGQLCAKGGALFDAVEGTSINVESDAYLAWSASRSQEPIAAAGETANDVDADGQAYGDDGSAGAVLSVMDLTLREVVEKFGTQVRFGDWLKAAKLIEEVREKRLKNYATERSLISRELVTSNLLGLLEELSRRLLADGVKTITRRTYAAAKNGTPIEEQEGINRGIISQNLKKARDQITRRIKKAK